MKFPAGNRLPGISACQKSLAEFAARRRQRDSDHFLSGRTPGWSLLPLRGNSPPVPDRKYNSGCKSSAAALCRAQPPQAALSASLCELFAIGEQGVRAADCKNLSEKPVRGFSTVCADSFPKWKGSAFSYPSRLWITFLSKMCTPTTRGC